MLLGKLKAFLRSKPNKLKVVFVEDGHEPKEVGRVSKGMFQDGTTWSKKEAAYQGLDYKENAIFLHKRVEK